MAYSKKLIHFATRANFDAQLAANNILGTSICFIKDAKQIWTHGLFYSCPFTEEEIEQLFVGSKIKLDGYIEMASPINILETDTVNEAFGKIEDFLTGLTDLNAILVDTGDVASDPTINDYITPSELNSTLLLYITESELESSVSELVINKQDRNLYFNNITASNWVASTEYSDYNYQCDITCEGVDDTMYAEVIFAMTEAISGDYAPICKTENNIVRLYSKVNTLIVIPTIIINK